MAELRRLLGVDRAPEEMGRLYLSRTEAMMIVDQLRSKRP